MLSNSVRDRLHGVVAGVLRRFTALRYEAVPEPHSVVQARSPAGHFGSATLFGARSVRFAPERKRQEHEAELAALAKARRTAYVARLWADSTVVWAT